MAYGVAHQNRANAAMRAQFDREMEARWPAMDARMESVNMRDQNERLKARVAELEQDLTRARRCLAASRIEWTIERECWQEKLSAVEKRYELIKDWYDKARSRETEIMGRWRKCSAMIRALLSPEQVQAYRDNYDETDLKIG